MSRPLRVLAVTVATFVTTELIFRLSRFRYGLGSVFAEPFDLVNFTVEAVWWFGAWCLYWWALPRLVRRFAGRGHKAA